MATHSFTLNVDGETGNNLFSWIAPSTVNAMTPGDTLSVTARFRGTATGTVSISGFSSIYHTDTSDMVLSSGQTLTRVIKSSGYTPPVVLTMTAYKSGFANANRTYTVLNPSDTTPDPFDLGPARTLVPLNSPCFSNRITVTGINQTVTATVSGTGAVLRKNYSTTNYTSVSVVNGDLLQVILDAASGYSSTRTATLTVGGVTDTFSVTTYPGPGSGIRIPFPFSSAPFKLSDIANFFGGTGTLHTPAKLFSSYVRGGLYVPDIPENSAIAMGVGMLMSQFKNASHSLYLLRPPAAQQAIADTSQQAKTLAFKWSMDGAGAVDPVFGYGYIYNQLEFRYTMSVTTGSPILASNGSDPGAWGTNNNEVQVFKSSGMMTEGFHRGVVTMYARFKGYPSAEISMTAAFDMSFYGP